MLQLELQGISLPPVVSSRPVSVFSWLMPVLMVSHGRTIFLQRQLQAIHHIFVHGLYENGGHDRIFGKCETTLKNHSWRHVGELKPSFERHNLLSRSLTWSFMEGYKGFC